MSTEQSQSAFKAGIELEQAVSNALQKLGVPHTLTNARVDIVDKIDLIVFPSPFTSGFPFEFQLTLRNGLKQKMVEFVIASLRSSRQSIRIYLEILGNRHNSIKYMADRVAYAIKAIMRDPQYSQHKTALGIRVRIGRRKRSPQLEIFDLLNIVGDAIKEILQKEVEERRENRRKRKEQLKSFRERIIEARMKNIPTILDRRSFDFCMNPPPQRNHEQTIRMFFKRRTP
ncbi:hypothetical protein HQ487_03990 [Candidatus Uhrbacteria bacterium]|nr:hypothetical protein [Candidatus Uhrbacteria bacterium]